MTRWKRRLDELPYSEQLTLLGRIRSELTRMLLDEDAAAERIRVELKPLLRRPSGNRTIVKPKRPVATRPERRDQGAPAPDADHDHKRFVRPVSYRCAGCKKAASRRTGVVRSGVVDGHILCVACFDRGLRLA